MDSKVEKEDDFKEFVKNCGATVYGAIKDGSSDAEKWLQKLHYTAGSASTKLRGSSLLFLADYPGNSLDFRAIAPDQQSCREICSEKMEEVLDFYRKCVKELGQALVDRGLGADKKHTDRRLCFDQAIRLFTWLSMDYGNQDVLFPLAQACYLRSKIILLKGGSIPEKKLELLNRALDYLKLYESIEKSIDKLVLMANIYLDLKRLNRLDQEDQEKLESIFKEFIPLLANQDLKQKLAQPEIRRIVLAIAERSSNRAGNPSGKKLLEAIIEDNKGYSLDKARAYLALNNKEKCLAYADKAIQYMENQKLSFSHEDWDILVRLLFMLWQDSSNEDDIRKTVQKCIIQSWEAVCKLEQRQRHGLHIRWYWSRQRDLYDLAFHAAEKLQLQAEIIDSLKSRPAMHLSSANELGIPAKDLEREMAALLDQYVIYGGDDRNKAPKAKQTKKKWAKLPESWIAVHFYLSHEAIEGDYGRSTGYALIHNNVGDHASWTIKAFNYAPLWECYCQWQEQHFIAAQKHPEPSNWEARSKIVAPSLKRVCKEIGKQMGWLFDQNLFPNGKPVVLIPHNFLHRMPLQFAMQNVSNELEIFKYRRPISFLPAWWMAEFPFSAPTTANSKENRVLINYDNVKDTFTETLQTPKTTVQENATPENLLALNPSPKRLGIFAHGQAPYGNPYEARLKLSGGDVSIAQLLTTELDIKGSEIILSACETDMMPPLTSPVDEHVTFATALLQKGAAAVIGSQWEARDGNAGVQSLLKKAIESQTPLHEQLWDWSAPLIEDYDDNSSEIYNIAALRVIGLPIFDKEKTDD